MPLSLLLIPVAVACVSPGQAARASQQFLPREAQGRVLIPRQRDSARYEVRIPPGVRSPRAVIVFINNNLDRWAYDDRDWSTMCSVAQCALLRLTLPRRTDLPAVDQPMRNAARGGADALLAALRSAAHATGASSIAEAGVVIFGFSQSGNFGPTFSGLHPERTIGVIQYHSNMRGIPIDSETVARIPTLSISGAVDDIAGTADAEALWRGMRRRNAPWAWVSHAGQPHNSIDGLVDAGSAIRSWITGVLALHSAKGLAEHSSDAVGGGWLVGASRPLIATDASDSTRDRHATSWLPNGPAALKFRQLAGACASLAREAAQQVLGDSTVVVHEDTDSCRYGASAAKRDLWLAGSSLASNSAAASQLSAMLPAETRRPLRIVDAAGYFSANAASACSVAGVTRLSWVYWVTLCGPGFGVPADSARLAPILRGLAGYR